MRGENSSEPLRVAVIGAGALGTFVAGLLASIPQPPTVVLVGNARLAPHLDAIRSTGLRLLAAPDLAVRLPAQVIAGIVVVDHAAACPPCDLAIVLVKHSRTADAAQQAARIVRPAGLVLTLQNGIGNFEILAATLGPDRVACGSTLLGAGLGAPGAVRAASLAQTTLAVEPRLSHGRQALLAALAVWLRAAGAPVAIVDDPLPVVWAKLVVNCAVNPVGALLDMTNGALVADAAASRVVAAAARETAHVALQLGIALPFAAAAAPGVALDAARASAANYNSMVQDLRSGRATEIDALNGAVVRAAQAAGIDAPINALLADLIRARGGP